MIAKVFSRHARRAFAIMGRAAEAASTPGRYAAAGRVDTAEAGADNPF
jgi:hypothetical protein